MKRTVLATIAISLVAALALTVAGAPRASAYTNGYYDGPQPLLEEGDHYYDNGYPDNAHQDYRRSWYRWSFWRDFQWREGTPMNWMVKNWIVNHHGFM